MAQSYMYQGVAVETCTHVHVDQKQYKLREPPREQYLTSGAEE